MTPYDKKRRFRRSLIGNSLGIVLGLLGCYYAILSMHDDMQSVGRVHPLAFLAMCFICVISCVNSLFNLYSQKKEDGDSDGET